MTLRPRLPALFGFAAALSAVLGATLITPQESEAASRQRTSLRHGLRHRVAFETTWSRYPAPDMILRDLARAFPSVIKDASTYSGLPESCRLLMNENRVFLGDSVPATGRPAVESPNQSFASWHASCVTAFIRAEAELLSNSGALNAETLIEILGSTGAEAYLSANPKREGGPLWSSLPVATRIEIARGFVRHLIGPEEVLIELDIAESEDAYARELVTIVDRFGAQPDTSFAFLFAAGAAFDLRAASMMMKFLIKLEEMKY